MSSIFKTSMFKVPRHDRFAYEPRFSKADQENKERIRFATNNLYGDDSHNLAGKMRYMKVAARQRNLRAKARTKMLFLIALLAGNLLSYQFEAPILLVAFFNLIFLVLFIRQTNKV